ncbi:TK kinase, partial [Paramuricea clavata]
DTPYSSVSDRDLKDFLLAGKRLEKVDSCTGDIYEIMLKCWSHLPKDRPTFTELSDKLWDLEHKEKPYVNLDSLMQQSVESEGMQTCYI